VNCQCQEEVPANLSITAFFIDDVSSANLTHAVLGIREYSSQQIMLFWLVCDGLREKQFQGSGAGGGDVMTF
jgi:hypothetical protein